MSARPNTCQMVPTTFQGISSGSAIRIRHTGTPMPFFGIDSAMAIPSGISMASTMAGEDEVALSSASWKRLEVSTSSYHSVPAQKNSLSPKVSCTE